VTVTCGQHAYPDNGCLFLDRFVTYTAEVRRSGAGEVIARTSAEVVYRFDLDGGPAVEVRQWDPDASGPVSTTSLPPCSTASSTTTSTTTTTTEPPTTTTTASTTTIPPTTVVPGTAVRTEWQTPTKEQKGSNWMAVAPMKVTTDTGEPVDGALVKVAVEYQESNSPTWVRDADIVGDPTVTGSVTFHSKEYRRSGNPHVTHVRFTVVSVEVAGHVWDSAAFPLTVEVAGP
jgi:hypothetical protein